MNTHFDLNSRFHGKINHWIDHTTNDHHVESKSMEIKYVIGESSLGMVLVACSVHGVCAIYLGNNSETLIQELRKNFSHSELIKWDDNYEQLLATVVSYIESPAQGLQIALDIRGTEFQQRVWQVLQDIPVGTTMSYAEIAKKTGSPKAVRAVAGACAANNLAVVIPCHRVIRSDGGLSGYRWGIDRKRTLLKKEAGTF